MLGVSGLTQFETFCALVQKTGRDMVTDMVQDTYPVAEQERDPETQLVTDPEAKCETVQENDVDTNQEKALNTGYETEQDALQEAYQKM